MTNLYNEDILDNSIDWYNPLCVTISCWVGPVILIVKSSSLSLLCTKRLPVPSRDHGVATKQNKHKENFNIHIVIMLNALYMIISK